jgi:hypothetical protein
MALPWLHPESLIITGCEVDSAPIRRWDFSNIQSPYRHIDISDSSLSTAPFLELLAFAKTGPLTSLKIPTLLPKTEAYIDSSGIVGKMGTPTLEDVQLKGTFTISAVLKLLASSPNIRTLQLGETKTASIKASQHTIRLHRLLSLNGSISYVSALTDCVLMSYLECLHVRPDAQPPTNKTHRSYCRRLNTCLDRCKPRKLFLSLPRTLAQNPKLPTLEQEGLSNLKGLMLSGSELYPAEMILVSHAT